MERSQILIVEDNEEVRELLKIILSTKGFEVKGVALGREAIAICEDSPPDIVILDLTLPDIDGLEVCKKIKSFPRMENVPILICSARSYVSERVKGLEMGADDYLSKPFDPLELVARVKVLLRRAGQHPPETRKMIQSGELRLEPQNYRILISGKKLEGVTPREFDILYLLLQESSRIVTRSEISKFIFGKDLDEKSRAIDMHISQLRKKLKLEWSNRIVTIPLKGYFWSK